MRIAPSQRPSFPHSALSRLTGYDQESFAQSLEDLAEVNFAEFEADKCVDAENAYLLAAAAALVYESPQAQADFLAAQPEVTAFQFLDSQDNERLGHQHQDTGTQVSLISTDDALIVSARGTVFAQDGQDYFEREWEDVINNVNVMPRPNYDRSAFIHSGFKNAADGIWEQLKPQVQKAVEEGKALHFTGHSLGAAIATNLSDRTILECQQGPTSLVTFGGPAVGWDGSRSHLENAGIGERSLRFADSGDPTVWAVPGGRHAGPEGLFDREGHLVEGRGWNVLERLGTAWDDWQLKRHPISHHHPLNYCQRVASNSDVLKAWESSQN